MAEDESGTRFRIMSSTPVLLLAVLVVFIDSLGYGVVVPLFPHYAEVLGANDLALGFLYATYAIALLIFAVPIGVLADRYGRKPFILFGMFAMSGSFVFYALADSYLLLVIARLLDGATAAATWSAALALVGDRFSESESGQKYGYLFSAIAMASIAGPLLGGVLYDAAGIRAPFFLIAALCAIGGFISIFLREEWNVEAKGSARWRKLLGLVLGNRMVMIACFLEMMLAMGLGILEPLLPVRLDEKLLMSATAIGLVFGAATLAEGITSPFFGWVSDRIGRKKPIIAGIVATACIFPLMAVVENRALIYIIMAAAGAVFAMFGTSSLPLATDALVESEVGGERPHGTAFGVLNVAYSLGMILGPIWGGAISDAVGLFWALIVYSGLLLITCFMTWKLL
ncbi:MAG: MFS transporter [Actinobacteria bacterium]|nr:MFS transporter [Actinomycetota bacterium]